ncbi:S-adenosyl-L-methionine-dependent methyltransferase [Phialemonium atrogriseum]|uniref:S-adenosyl-L-methionine-dependent methyltransferase n=1 Tax=Phialemonium atrogriseum TaxID=1093897 RepID=A0AAJ0CEF8_9PEZI|nr:S-adenosyl-L-methionine-dependent methyltransferase [Phialemonium atrogriseum]KAK1772791.1 S-adenosyl-L-methionine-dependent methyltransferase [Phialemonium atrogriseum]
MSSPKTASPKAASPKAASPKTPESPAAAQPQDGVIEVDNDADSAYSASTQVTDGESLRSSILNYKWENGRRYHAYEDGAYWGPNDDRQQEAEDLMHEMYRIIMDDKLYAAPIGDNPQSVLDVGCGTGIWAIDFADAHPSADVLGVDLSPIQPNFVPPNCRFEVDDINKDWTFPENKFDFVHIRAMTGCIPDWTEFYAKAMKHVKPGGFVEHVELWGIASSDDNTLRADSPLKTWVDIFEKIGAATGKCFFWGDRAADSMREAGLADVTERRVKVPIGPWPKDKRLKHWGTWNRQFLLQALEGFSIRGMTELLGWKYDDAQLFLVEMRNELKNPNLHSYVDLTIIYGQKPKE